MVWRLTSITALSTADHHPIQCRTRRPRERTRLRPLPSTTGSRIGFSVLGPRGLPHTFRLEKSFFPGHGAVSKKAIVRRVEGKVQPHAGLLVGSPRQARHTPPPCEGALGVYSNARGGAAMRLRERNYRDSAVLPRHPRL